MKFALYLIGFILVALIVSFLIPTPGAGGDPERNLPWQIEVDGQGGSTVFGLQPGHSTLADVRAALGDDFEVAVIARPDEIGAVEAYYNQVALGFVLARMVVTLDVAPETVVAMRERALKAQHMESTTRKITLHPDDLAQLEQARVRALAVIPTVNLDEATVIQRFGQPAERLQVSEKRVHLLYPRQGLDVVVDGDGKELLQYVAPRDFALLREPLRAGGGN
ncbi:MAG: hypothetical protein LBE81_05220 [Azonexus sp.]|jgi:hypothetical protein|uniref:hypothetical protein n=1 Tax=Azonexus sp. TaxID=1872668 RepID=UPI00282BC9F7|nr:hypothetical protein [Azonexus sp.]MDR0776021.1 hypothetical protein [Azonexus sp.]